MKDFLKNLGVMSLITFFALLGMILILSFMLFSVMFLVMEVEFGFIRFYAIIGLTLCNGCAVYIIYNLNGKLAKFIRD